MKRLLYLVLVITLPLIAFFKYQEYRRFHPPVDYQWEINPDIDVNYHDPEVLLKYYQYAEETGTYARWAWAEHGIDVRTPEDDDPETKEIVARYQQYIAVLRYLEDKLTRSTGPMSQASPRLPEASTSPQVTTPRAVDSSETLGSLVFAQRGDESALVRDLQQMLAGKGYSLKIDGIFDAETESTLKAFQQDQRLDTTGHADLHTLTLLKTQ